jgi:hypothetical protein
MALVIVARCISSFQPGQDGLAPSPLVAVVNEPPHYVRHDKVRKNLSVVVTQVLR